MSISKQQLYEAVLANIITEEQAGQLEELFEKQTQQLPQLTLTHVLYYFGGCLAIVAMSLLMSLSWKTFGGGAIFLLAILYAGVGLKAMQVMVAKQLHIPRSICAVFVVSVVPVGVYGLLQWLNVWPEQLTSYSLSMPKLALELSTLVAGVLMLRFIATSLTTLPVVLAIMSLAWHMAVFALNEDIARQGEQWIHIGLAVLMLAGAFVIDRRIKGTADFAFWAYFISAVALWYALSELVLNHELPKVAYFMLNLVMVAVGTLLARRVFVVLGALGSIGYLSYLAFDVFQGSWLFVAALTAIGFAIVFIGVWLQKSGQGMGKR